MNRLPRGFRDAFWQGIDTERVPGCWIVPVGYFIYVHGKGLRADKISWFIHNRKKEPLLDGERIYRTCGTLCCVNPKHLSLTKPKEDK